MENVMDLLAYTHDLYLIHCSNCKKKFTSLDDRANMKHIDINSNIIKYFKYEKKRPTQYR